MLYSMFWKCIETGVVESYRENEGFKTSPGVV